MSAQGMKSSKPRPTFSTSTENLVCLASFKYFKTSSSVSLFLPSKWIQLKYNTALNPQSGQNFPPEVSEVDILEVLERELRETEVGVDDSSGAGGGVGENHRVRTDLT